ncbi:Cuticle protein 6 [Pseudolycoriella hygida]|uniref:Cuticle protein 6 n=1 Tax=Pseudolycoriella hygida TaxID=35572 RepID=A0A9Q0N0Q0_9DIPT|nr:Cuticle protein 6 [Pseudolycoriella hygida]
MFGYSDWNQGRLEARNANGEVRGSYQYVDPYGEDVIVNYWSDRLGFHQMDNRPKLVMNPVTETPEVQAARAAHEKAWAAAAAAARLNPDPMSDVYNANSNKLDEEQSEADQAMEIISGVANQQQRFPNLPYNNELQEDEEGAFSHDSIVIESKGEARSNEKLSKLRTENNDEEEEPSNPRGFFYNFDYPVQLILENPDDRQQRSVIAEKSQTSSTNEKSELSAEVAEYKIVKRSENSKSSDDVSDITEDKNKIAEKNLKEISETTQVKAQTGEAQIPVFVKVESEDRPSEVLLKSEMELKSLATNKDVIDAIHDAQIHRKVQA